MLESKIIITVKQNAFDKLMNGLDMDQEIQWA